MSKGLEALAKIRFVEVQIGNDPYTAIGVFDINNDYNEYFRIVKKELTALEIIKEKKVNVSCIMSGWSLEKYNSYKTHISLVQEEYKLLKEVF